MERELLKITDDNLGEIRLKWLTNEIELEGKPLKTQTDIKIGDVYRFREKYVD